MKKIKFVLSAIIILFIASSSIAQDLQIIKHETFKYDTLGKLIIFHFEAVNVSPDTQNVFAVRKINDLPTDWTSSLCFGETCYSHEVDSVTTGPPSPNPPLAPGDTLEASLDVQTMNNNGTAYVQIQIGTLRNPTYKDTLNFVATTDPSVSVDEGINLNDYSLAQNYPNPFNPSTKIGYRVKEAGFVSLEVYNILGVKVATLINEYMPAGNYIADFVAFDLASGVYIYKLSVNNFTQTRKMILEK